VYCIVELMINDFLSRIVMNMDVIRLCRLTKTGDGVEHSVYVVYN
jgi:hypothetical protein